MNSSLQNTEILISQHDSNSQFVNPAQKQDAPEYEGWLLGEFSRPGYQLYRIWLVLTLFLVGYVNFQTISIYWEEVKNAYSYLLVEMEPYDPIIVLIGSFLLIFGFLDMFWAMQTRTAEMAQQSMWKFQYSLGLLATSSGLFMYWSKWNLKHYSILAWIVTFGLPAISAVYIIGGVFVLRAFKKDFLLRNQSAPQTPENHNIQESLSQTAEVRSQLLNFDLRLASWPFWFYRLWLKFAIIIEMIMVPNNMVFLLASVWRDKQLKPLLQLLLPILAHFLGGFCSYFMGIVLNTRSSDKSTRAMVYIRICLVMSAVFSVFLPLLKKKNLSSIENYSQDLLLNLAKLFGVPFVTWIGAFFANRIIEEREGFVEISPPDNLP